MVRMTSEGFVVWLTGLPGSGKTTIAHLLADSLRTRGVEHIEVLDGDVLRSTPLSSDLRFSREDRDANVRRVGFVAELLARNGVAVIVALVSPYEAAREEVRALIPHFVLVHVDCDAAELERRDPKGHYARAKRGEIASFTGVSDPYEPPANPDLLIRTDRMTLEASAKAILALLERKSFIGGGVRL
jgi:adenylyl-sulfate kinase